MFTITSSKGFHITFPSGIVLSTQFGGGCYCDNHDMEIGTEKEKYELESEDAEIAIWDANDKWLTSQAYKELFNDDIGDDIKGNVKIKEWLRILDWCRAYKSENKKGE